MTEKKKRSQHEFELCCMIWDAVQKLRVPGIFISHWPNGEERPDGAGGRLKRIGTVPGVADYVILAKGVAYGLEVKLADNLLYGTKQTNPSAVQDAFKEQWERAGGVYAVVRGLDETLAQLEAWGLIKPNLNERRD